MKIEKEIRNDGSISYKKTYDNNEKMIQAILWKRTDGKISKSTVEDKVPGSKYLETRVRNVIMPNLNKLTIKLVMIERTFNRAL